MKHVFAIYAAAEHALETFKPLFGNAVRQNNLDLAQWFNDCEVAALMWGGYERADKCDRGEDA